MANILIANDNPDLLDCCQSILEGAGHSVEVVADGREAILLARRWLPDLILIDWVMPNIDGPSAIEVLRADPATTMLPILLMSGSEGAEAVAAAVGADGFLRKPFAAAALVSRVDDLLRNRGAGTSPP
jgi:two-component system alkaline phosphatase synthesis response regulator PhoP